jgi:peptidoglycan/LPS O-acetylase OafA/YrhL
MTVNGDPTGSASDGPGFRPDIEGLRGIAVLLVVLFHAGLPIPGGFIGVDVFFVISGFLITGLLVREHERTGRVSLSNFYARRIRRLLPAAAVVVLVTLGGAFAFIGLLDRPSVMTDGAAAALSVSNIRFALAEGSYFTAIGQPSPFLHFWSLSVEEQFYLVWPALLLFVARGRRRWVGAVLIAVLAGSFAANLYLTETSISWAFYSLPTRAWQLALGGLLAVAGTWPNRLPRIVGVLATLAGWAALAGLVAAAMLIGERTPYPGTAALAPAVAGAVLIASGTARWGAGLILSSTPIRFLGRISYSLYLWHWPILVLVPLAVGATLPVEARSILVLAAVAVAWASWRFVEEPFHHGMISAVLVPRRAIAIGLASIVVVVVVSTGLEIRTARAIDEIALATAAPTPAPTASPAPTPSATPSGSSGASHVPATPEPSLTPEPTPTLAPLLTWQDIPDASPPDPIPLTADIRPALADARTDTEALYRDRCASQLDDPHPKNCVYGNKAGTFTVALIGDSHAGAWFPAIEALAIDRGWRLVPYVKLSCPFIDMKVEHLDTSLEYTECEAWREELFTVLAQRPPDLTIVAMSHRGIFPLLAEDKTVERQSQAIARAVARVPGRVFIMIDTPRTGDDIPGCIAGNFSDVRPCAISRSRAFTSLFGAREAQAAALAGAGIIDLIPAVCPAMACQVVRDGMILYRDNHHLTATFSRSLAPALGDALARYLPD